MLHIYFNYVKTLTVLYHTPVIRNDLIYGNHYLSQHNDQALWRLCRSIPRWCHASASCIACRTILSVNSNFIIISINLKRLRSGIQKYMFQVLHQHPVPLAVLSSIYSCNHRAIRFILCYINVLLALQPVSNGRLHKQKPECRHA